MTGVLLLVLIVGSLVLVLELTHRRHLGGPTTPPRATTGSDRDRERAMAELRFRAQADDSASVVHAPTSERPPITPWAPVRTVSYPERSVPAKASRAS